MAVWYLNLEGAKNGSVARQPTPLKRATKLRHAPRPETMIPPTAALWEVSVELTGGGDGGHGEDGDSAAGVEVAPG